MQLRGGRLLHPHGAPEAGIPPADTRVAIQGFGNVGSNLAGLLSEEGVRVIAVSDSGGGIHNAYGLDVAAAIAYKAEHGVLEGFPGADAITNEELIEIDCDVLAPCALEQVITAENASRVRAKMICEGANGPTTPGADEILEDRGILVLPDVLANAGGVVVSYFEWVQGLQEYFWKEYEVTRSSTTSSCGRSRRPGRRATDLPRACGWPPTGSRCSGWPRRPRFAASTPDLAARPD